MCEADASIELQKANHRVTISELVDVEEQLESYKVVLCMSARETLFMPICCASNVTNILISLSTRGTCSSVDVARSGSRA